MPPTSEQKHIIQVEKRENLECSKCGKNIWIYRCRIHGRTHLLCAGCYQDLKKEVMMDNRYEIMEQLSIKSDVGHYPHFNLEPRVKKSQTQGTKEENVARIWAAELFR